MGAGRDAGLSRLPSVHELAAELDAPHVLAVAAARRAIEEQRAAMAGDAGTEVSVLQRAHTHLAALTSPSLRRVLNATGVIVHTNLGRAPLPESARTAVTNAASGYSNLELNLVDGTRGARHAHVEGLLRELTGAKAATVVNNGAGAVLLAVAALAGPGAAILISRGQLVEIGGGFRIPDVIAQSGSVMLEVGTTNRTRLADYERALAGAELRVGAILRVHQSNFRTLGFVEDVATKALCGLGVPVIDDVGSGVLADAGGILALGDEPSLRASVAAGAGFVSVGTDIAGSVSSEGGSAAAPCSPESGSLWSSFARSSARKPAMSGSNFLSGIDAVHGWPGVAYRRVTSKITTATNPTPATAPVSMLPGWSNSTTSTWPQPFCDSRAAGW